MRPTILAARCSVAMVTLPSFGSSRRLIWPGACAELRFHGRGDLPCQDFLDGDGLEFFELSFLRQKSSRVVSASVERAVFFSYFSYRRSLRRKFTFPLARQSQVLVRIFFKKRHRQIPNDNKPCSSSGRSLPGSLASFHRAEARLVAEPRQRLDRDRVGQQRQEKVARRLGGRQGERIPPRAAGGREAVDVAQTSARSAATCS